MKITKEIVAITYSEMVKLFDGGDDAPDPKDETKKNLEQYILEMATDLAPTDVFSAKAAYVLDSMSINIPPATLLDLGVEDIKDYNFDIKSSLPKKSTPKSGKISKADAIASIKEAKAKRDGKTKPDSSPTEPPTEQPPAEDKTLTENTNMVAIPQKKFNEVLKLLAPGVGNKNSLIKNAMHVIFDYDYIYSFNGQICVIQPLKTRVNGSVSYNYLKAIMSKFGPDDIIEITGIGDTIELSSGKSQFTLSMDHTAPPDFNLPELHWSPLPPDFLQGIKTCHDSAHGNEDLGLISCIYMKSDKLVAFDNVRAIKYTMEESVPDVIYIPKKVAKLCYSKYAPTEIAVNEAWILFRNPSGVCLAAKTMFGEYPATKSILKIRSGDLFKFSNKSFTALLERASIVADEDDNKVKSVEIELFPLKLICRAGNGVDMFQEDLDIQYTGAQRMFKADPKAMIDIIKRTDELFIDKKTVGYAGENVFGCVSIISV